MLMLTHTGVKFDMDGFLLALLAIGKRLEPPDYQTGVLESI